MIADNLPKTSSQDPLTEESPPLYHSDALYGLIPHSPEKNFPMREILARLVDRSEFNEFKKEYGTSLICGFGKIFNRTVGIIANDGILFSESALKGAHFVQLCNQRKIPLLFLQNIVGFMVGKEYEHKGIAKAGAKMVTAVACSTVPKITIVVGGSFGAGNYAMSGRAYQPRFLYMWPNARISVMGPEQAAGVLTQIKRDAAKAKKTKWPKAEENRFKKEIEEQYQSQASAYYSTSRLWDDGIIDPLDTRILLKETLQICSLAPTDETKYGVFRM